MPPPTPHIIQGTITNKGGVIVVGVDVTVTIDSGSITVQTDNSGLYVTNLASIGTWSVGDTISVYGYKIREGEITGTVVASSGPSQTVNLVLSQEDRYVAAVPTAAIGYNKVVLSDYEGINHGKHYPLPIMSTDDRVDLVLNPSFLWTITRSDGQADSITVTIANGDVYKKTFTYTTINNRSRRTGESKWVKE